MSQEKTSDTKWNMHCARDFHRTRLQPDEEKRCLDAVEQFRINPKHPGLNFEPLGRTPKANHYSIRASQELRVILALDCERKICILANKGHHDPIYEWSDRQRHYTDPAQCYALDNSVAQSNSLEEQIQKCSTLEEWMLFLHPSQKTLVDRQYAGSARIRGSAGTGKTVVALHRAAVLGRRYPKEKVLFTSFSRSLCNRLKEAFEKLPEAPDNVEFINIDRVAYRFLDPKPSQNIVNKDFDAAFDAAYQRVLPGSSIKTFNADYLKEEIRRVIKGRAPTKDEYLDTDRFERMGRLRSLKKNDREACWRLAQAWDQEVQKRGLSPGFPDRLIQARDQAWDENAPKYRAVIVDEAQDMSKVGMDLVRALVAGKPDNPVPSDGVLIVDDSAQRIYAGGFRFSWVGLDVRGRSETLQVNYRNTASILRAARALHRDVPIIKVDNDDGAAVDVEPEREEGAKPVFYKTSKKGELLRVWKIIEELINEGLKPEEIALVMRNSKDLGHNGVYKFLEDKKIQYAKLADANKGELPPGIRVGTLDRAKGWEFRAVLIPRLGASQFPRRIAEHSDDPQQSELEGMEAPPENPSDETKDEEKEARMLDLDRLYVGMTRARDYLFLIADEEPCKELQDALDHFEYRSG